MPNFALISSMCLSPFSQMLSFDSRRSRGTTGGGSIRGFSASRNRRGDGHCVQDVDRVLNAARMRAVSAGHVQSWASRASIHARVMPAIASPSNVHGRASNASFCSSVAI